MLDSSKVRLPLQEAQIFHHPCSIVKTTACSVARKDCSTNPQAAPGTMSSLISSPQGANSHRLRQLPFKMHLRTQEGDPPESVLRLHQGAHRADHSRGGP